MAERTLGPVLAATLKAKSAKLGAPVVVDLNHFFHSRTLLLSRTCHTPVNRAWPQM